MSKTIYIGGRLESKEKGNVVTGANAILDDTKGKKQNVINKETDDELARLEQSKQDNLNFDNAPTEDSTNPVTSGGVYTAEKALSDAIEAILLLIPSAATALNKLVDTNTMNSSISTATATFRGTYNAVSDLGLTYQATHAQIEAALDSLGLTADNNDFAFVQIPVSDQSQDIAKTERFKFNGTNWLYEYDLNTSGFTAAQWAAINSGITVALVTKLTDLPTAAALQLALNAKQDNLTFDTEPTALSQNPVTSGGIYTAIQAVATALSDYSTTTDGRLNVLEGLVPTAASSSNKLTDKAYVDGLIQAITELIPAEATSANQLADKAYVLAQILASTPAFKGQFTTLAELQAVASPKAGDLGIVRTKDSDGMDVFTVYQYLSNAWNVFYSLSYHPQTKPATTGTTGDYPYNGMGRVELAMNMVNTGTELAPVMVNQLTQDMFYKGAVGSRVPNTNTIFVIRYDYVLAENITIPDGCVLEFEGGSISGAYTLTGANTGIKADLVKIFDTTTTLAGTWNVAEAYPEWFGAKGDGINDDTEAIQKAINFNAPTIFGRKVYCISNTINIPDAKIIKSFTEEVTYDLSLKDEDSHLQSGFIKATDSMDAMLHIKGQSVIIENIALIGNRKANYGIYSSPSDSNITRINLNNIYVYSTLVSCYYITCYNLVLNRCNANGGHIEDSYGFIIGNSSTGNPHIVMNMCYARNCSIGYSIRNTSYIVISSPGCDDCGIGYDFYNIHQGEVVSLGLEKADTPIRLRGNIHYLAFLGLAITPNVNANIFEVNTNSRCGYVTIRDLYLDNAVNVNEIASIIHNVDGNVITFDVDSSVNKYLCNASLKEIHYNLCTSNMLANAEVDPDQLGIVEIIRKYDGAISIKKTDPSVPFSSTLPVHLGTLFLKRGIYQFEYIPIGEADITAYELSLSKSKWNTNEIKNTERNRLHTNTLVLTSDTTVYLGLRFFKDAFFHSTLILPLFYKVADIQTKEAGTYATKPSADEIGVGFKYFCTDRQTVEGATDGIEIIHKGNDVWVDALGRLIL